MKALPIVLALAALLALFFAMDPLGVMSGQTNEEEAPPETDPGELGGRPELRGDPEAAARREAAPTEIEGDPVGELDLGLGSGTYFGVVVDMAGKAVRYARVRPMLPGLERDVAVRAGQDGEWRITGLPDSRPDLRVSAEGYRTRTVVPPAVVADSEIEVEPVELLPRTGLRDYIAVHVSGPDGAPLSGAKVTATTMNWDLYLAMGPEMVGIRDSIAKEGTTDEKGRTRIGPLPPEEYNVVVRKEGYTLDAIEDVIVSGGGDRRLRFSLAKEVTLTGVVEDYDGQPIEGAQVMAMHQPSFKSSEMATTDAEGRYTVTGLKEGRYMIIAAHDSAGVVMGQGAAPGEAKALRLGGSGVIEGKVVDTEGEAVSGVEIRAYHSQPFGYVYSFVREVEADGTFRLEMPRGTYTLRARTGAGALDESTKATVEIGETVNVTITMPKPAMIEGVVVDEDGHHVEGAEVYVMMGGFPPSPSREQYARTDAEGAFAVSGLGGEQVTLHVVHPDFANTTFTATPGPAGEGTPHKIELTRGARILGRVADAEGNPVSGEQVSLFQDWFNARSTHTDEQGRYVFTAVEPGTWNVNVGRFENAAPGMSKNGINVGQGGDVVVDFVAQAGTGTVTGLVRLNGTPIAGASVVVTDGRGDANQVSVQTDAQGRFTAEGIQPGQIRVWVVATETGTSTRKWAEFAEGETTHDMTIDLGTGGIRFRVIDLEGRPVSGAWISIEDADAEDEGWTRVKVSTQTAQEGIAEANGLEAGRFLVRISSPHHAQWLSDPIPLGENEQKDLGDIQVKAGAIISGRVTNDAGAPIEGATIGLEDENGRPLFFFSMSTTGSDGRYQLRGIEPGRYTVKFEAKGHAPSSTPVLLTADGATADGAMERGGEVQVTVVDDAGYPIPGAKVRLFDGSGKLVTKTLSLSNLFEDGGGETNAEGVTTFRDLAAGTYTVRAEKTGFGPSGEPTRFAIPPGGRATARVILVPTGG